VVNLALGLSGALLLDSLQGSVGRTLQAARARCSAPTFASLPPARSPPGRSRAWTPRPGIGFLRRRADVLDGLRRHARAPCGASRIDRHFPLHGALVLAAGGAVGADARERLDTEGHAWADPSLLDQLGIRLGDPIRIGTATFRVVDTLVRDTGLSMRAASLAPRLYVARSRVEATGLLRPAAASNTSTS